MKRSTPWIVGDYGIRPAGSPNHCFYCGQERGSEHKDGCVIRSRTVVVRFTVEVVVDQPEDFGSDLIEFGYNGSSWCQNNLINLLDEVKERAPDCMCGMVEAQFLREATPDDEARQGLRADDLPN